MDHDSSIRRRCHRHDRRRHRSFLTRWVLANSIISGVLALVWLVLRSGPRPSRLSYPCQQAAVSTAVLALAAPLVATLITLRQRVAAGLRTRAGMSGTRFSTALASLLDDETVAECNVCKPSRATPYVGYQVVEH